MTNWYQIGDFDQIQNSETIKRQCYYKNGSHNLIDYVHLIEYWNGTFEISANYEKRLHVGNSDFIASTRFASECKKIGFSKYEVFFSATATHIRTNDKEKLAAFLNIINLIDPLGDDNKQAIIGKLGITAKPRYINAVMKELEVMVNNDRVEEAIQKVSTTGDNDLFYSLGEYCQNLGRLNDAISCYQSVPKGNLYYSESNFRAGLILENFATHDDYQKHIVRMLNFFLMAAADGNPENQKKCDEIYDRLCGGEGNNQSIVGIKGDAQTLCAVARQLCSIKTQAPLPFFQSNGVSPQSRP